MQGSLAEHAVMNERAADFTVSSAVAVEEVMDPKMISQNKFKNTRRLFAPAPEGQLQHQKGLQETASPDVQRRATAASSRPPMLTAYESDEYAYDIGAYKDPNGGGRENLLAPMAKGAGVDGHGIV